jgi:hypothetical protein
MVQVSSSDSRAVLPRDHPFMGAEDTFTFIPGKVGGQSITVVDAATGIRGSISFNVVAVPGVVTTLDISGIPSTIKVPFEADTARLYFAVTAKDSYGNKIAGYRGTVRFTASVGVYLEVWDYTFTATDNGSHYFRGSSDLGGQSIGVVDTSNATVSGGVGFRVVPLPPPRGGGPGSSPNGGKHSTLTSTAMVGMTSAEQVMFGAVATLHTTVGGANAGALLPLSEDAWVAQFFARIGSKDPRLVLPSSRPRIEGSGDGESNEGVRRESLIAEWAVLLALRDPSFGVDLPIAVGTRLKAFDEMIRDRYSLDACLPQMLHLYQNAVSTHRQF